MFPRVIFLQCIALKLSLDPHYLMNPGKVFDFDPNATKSTPEATAASTLAKPKE